MDPPPSTGTASAPAAAPPPPQIPKTSAVYPWSPTAAAADRLDVRFADPPPGFTRVDVDEGTFGAMLRTLPLTPVGTKAVDYRGVPLYGTGAHANVAAVVDVDVGEKDLQHCADAIIRLHAEWRYGLGQRAIGYRTVSGVRLDYRNHLAGERPVAVGNDIKMQHVAAPHGDDHAFFRGWLDTVFDYASTTSLERDATKVALDEVRPGDFFVMRGSPFGHAVLVLDVAKHADGRSALLLGQSFMPAQSFQVLRANASSAWFVVDRGAAFVDTPFWRPFPASSLHRFAPESTAPRTRLTNADAPCKDCMAIVPETSKPAPLVVVLHGDSGATAADLANKWDRFAAPRDVGVLSLACPKDLGCNSSFWQWDGDPAWVKAQVDALAAKHPVDRTRLYLAGWSGGATWIGMRTQRFEETFAGLVIHGGGYVPRAEGCAKTKTPVAFLYGTGNPLHAHGVRLHDWYEACGDEVRTTLLPNADHAAELRALDDHGAAILDWLLNRRRASAASTSS